jgi:hypothetical protein
MQVEFLEALKITNEEFAEALHVEFHKPDSDIRSLPQVVELMNMIADKVEERCGVLGFAAHARDLGAILGAVHIIENIVVNRKLKSMVESSVK